MPKGRLWKDRRGVFGCSGWPVLVWSLPSASQGMLESNIFPPHVFPSLSLPLAQAVQGWAVSVWQEGCDLTQGSRAGSLLPQPGEGSVVSLILTSSTPSAAQHRPLESALQVINYWLWRWSALVRTERWEELFSLSIALCHLVWLQFFFPFKCMFYS